MASGPVVVADTRKDAGLSCTSRSFAGGLLPNRVMVLSYTHEKQSPHAQNG